jgi:hypothetical protein
VDDVVAIKARDRERGWIGVMTWGRLWDPIDETELLAAVSEDLGRNGYIVDEIELCDSLQVVRSAEYFYEGIISFSWQPPPFGLGYDAWRTAMREDLKNGRAIYILGPLDADE